MIITSRKIKAVIVLYSPLLLLGVVNYTHAQEGANNIPATCFTSKKSNLQNIPISKRFVDLNCTKDNNVQILDGSTLKNRDAQFTHNVPLMRRQWSLSGNGIKVGIWDGGKVLANHRQLDGRVSIGDPTETCCYPSTTVPLHEHATHVAGTIGANGNNAIQAQGMAPKADIISYFWDNDIIELFSAASKGISITNHSYGFSGGWEYGQRGTCSANWTWHGRDKDNEDVRFGLYEKGSEKFDQVIYENPTLSVFVAAGNERVFDADPNQFRNHSDPNVRFNGSHCVWVNRTWRNSTKHRESDLNNGGFDTMTGIALSKNVVTVGAASDLPRVFSSTEINVTDFSSMGPTDDGRIKPDVVANGDGLYSTYLPERCLRKNGNMCKLSDITQSENFLFVSESGSSMATPVASGIGALLNELANRKYGRTLYADEMKAALIHTAISPSQDGAPTYRWGWGLIDAFDAGALVAGNRGTLSRKRFNKESTKPYVKTFQWIKHKEDLTMTMVWLDKPGKVTLYHSAMINDRKPMLVNQLDFYLESPSGTKYFPWSLNPDHPVKKATRKGANLVDNVERIDINKTKWEKGKWRLIGKPTKLTSNVDVAIAISPSVKFE